MNYKQNPHWKIIFQDEKLYAYAGADASYELDLIQKQDLELFYQYLQNQDWLALEKHSSFQKTFQQLLKAGVFVPFVEKPKNTLNFSLQHLGEHGNFENIILDALKNYPSLKLVSLPESDLIVLLRYAESMENVEQLYKRESIFLIKPHLFLDLAYHHTFSLGPLVFPNQTACLQCLSLRHLSKWKEKPLPEQVGSEKHLNFIFGFLLEQLQIFADNSTCPDFIERVFHFNLQNFDSGFSDLFVHPECEVCGEKKSESV